MHGRMNKWMATYCGPMGPNGRELINSFYSLGN